MADDDPIWRSGARGLAVVGADPVGAARGAPAEPLPFLAFAEIEPDLAGVELVEDLLSVGAMSVIYGESNSGKTFFATDLGLRVAARMKWQQREVEGGPVVYLALEGAAGIKARVAAFRKYHGLEGEAVPFVVVTSAVDLREPEADTGSVIATIKAVGAKFGQAVRMAIVDTLSRAMAGGNENASEDMGALVGNGDKIRQETGAHLCWVHHSGKDQARGARGHSLLRAATDTEIEITAEGAMRMAHVTKQRELECTGDIAFWLKVVELGANARGKTVTSCVVVGGDQAAGAAPDRRLRLTGHNKRAFEVLADLVATAGQVGFSGAPPEIPTVPEKWWRERFYESAMAGAEQDAKQRAFRRAADYLVENRAVGLQNRRVWVV